MPVYILKTMSQDLMQARGEEPEELRIETEEAASHEKRRDYNSEKDDPQSPKEEVDQTEKPADPRHEGGMVGGEEAQEERKEKKEQAPGPSSPGLKSKLPSMPRIPILHDRRVLTVLVLFLVLFGFGAISYFGGGVGGAYVERIRGVLGVEQEEELSVDLKLPAGGEKWEKDKEYRIVWDFEGDRQKQINIVYLKSGVKVGTIAGNISLGALKQTWRIPQNLDPSAEYKIRINAVNPKEGSSPLLAESSFFSVVSASPEPDSPGGTATTSTTTTATTTAATSTATTTASSTKATTSVSDYETSPKIISFGHEKVLIFEENINPKATLENLINEREDERVEGLGRLKFILSEFEREMKPQRLFEELQMPLSEEIWADLGLDYNFFLYQQHELQAHDKVMRFGAVFETFAPKSTFEKMVQNEDQIDGLVQSDSYLLDAGSPVFEKYHTNKEDYIDLYVRYQNYPEPDLSFDYGVLKTENNGAYLIVATSRQGMEEIISRMRSNYELKEFKPDLSEVTAQ